MKLDSVVKSQAVKYTIALLGLILVVAAPLRARGADPDWKAVEQALGKSGQLQPGDVFRIGMPRTDLAVTVKVSRSRPGLRSDPTRPSSRWATARWSWATSSCSTRKCPR